MYGSYNLAADILTPTNHVTYRHYMIELDDKNKLGNVFLFLLNDEYGSLNLGGTKNMKPILKAKLLHQPTLKHSSNGSRSEFNKCNIRGTKVLFLSYRVRALKGTTSSMSKPATYNTLVKRRYV